MAQVTGENGHPTHNAASAALPPEQNPAGKRVPQIVEPDRWPRARGLQPASQLAKHHADSGISKPASPVGDKKVLGFGKEHSTSAIISLQCTHGRRMQRHPPAVVVFAFPDKNMSVGQVNVCDFQCQCFGDAQTSAGEQSQERFVC
jgi:hypothetical protein